MSSSLMSTISLLFNLLLDLSRLPLDCETVRMIPTFNKSIKDLAENNYPSSMTPAVVKVLERIVNSAVIRHLETNNLLHSSQHDFHFGRSVDTDLLESFN